MLDSYIVQGIFALLMIVAGLSSLRQAWRCDSPGENISRQASARMAHPTEGENFET